MVRDETMMNELMTPTQPFFDYDEMHPMQEYEGAPEHELFNREAYNVADDAELPQVTFMSATHPDELPPQHEDNTLFYEDIHGEVEKWQAFRALPEIMKYDRGMNQLQQDLKEGTIILPDYEREFNSPSLWPYYLTLPKWCRDNSLIRNVLFAFEYHQPRMDIRQKEMAMNLACSYI